MISTSQYKVQKDLNKEERNELLAFSDITAHLLFHRGIKNKDEAEAFISPLYDKGIHDPFLLNDMEKAVLRILKAIENKEHIVVFADYDADGIPGAVVFSDFFKKIGYENVSIYIPDRSLEGYGLNNDAIDSFHKDGTKLLITVDCGISNILEIKYANSLGFDVIITDHHIPKSELPEAFAIVNPKISNEYPEKMLCGAAVAWKVVCALLKCGDFDIKDGFEKWLLDMVGIATLSDMVPLQGENRTLSYFGLVVLRKSPRAGLQRLLKSLKITQKNLTVDDIAFMVTPRINAASRMGVAYDAFKLLTTEDDVEATELVKKIEHSNNERKGTAAFLSKEVKKKIEAKYSPYFSNKIIVVGDPSWKPSLLGIVANNISEHHGKPVFIWGREDTTEVLKGSCRSAGSLSLTVLMESVTPGVFTEFGGHHGAGGFSVSFDHIHTLEEELAEAYEKAAVVAEDKFVLVDKEIDIMDINENLLIEIEKLEPYGMSNTKPIFIIKGGEVGEVSLFGKEKNHLKVTLKSRRGYTTDAILFFANENIIQKVQGKIDITIVGHVERNFFGRGRVRVRLIDVL